jgi:hypothetical protein
MAAIFSISPWRLVSFFCALKVQQMNLQLVRKTSYLLPWTNYCNYIESKMSSYKTLPVKGLWGRCLSKFLDWRYSQSCWYFRPIFVNCCPSNLLFGSTLPPPSLCELVYCTLSLIQCGGGGFGNLGLIQINTCRKVPLKAIVLDDVISHSLLWVLSFYVFRKKFTLRTVKSDYTVNKNVQYSILYTLAPEKCGYISLQMRLYTWHQ